MSFRLSIVSGKGVGKEFFFSQPAVRIGRQADNDLVLYDTAVSRTHCEILTDETGFTLRDIGSSNGVLLNDQLVTEAKIEDGDRFLVGPVVFEFHQKRSGTKVGPVSGPGNHRAFAPQNALDQRHVEEQSTAYLPVQHELRRPPQAKPQRDEKARTPTGRFRAITTPSWLRRLKALPRSTQKTLVLATAVVLTGAVLATWVVVTRPPKDRSGELFRLSDATLSLRYGLGKVDISTPDRANFQFTWNGGRVTVSYATAAIDGLKELDVMINNKHVAYAPLAPTAWQTGITVVVPRAFLKKGINLLTFDNTYTPQQPERWGIAQVRVIEKPLPEQDAKRAEQLYALGKASFETRSVTPPNLWRAIGYFEEAGMLVEALDPLPPIAAEIEQAHARARQELQSVFEQYLVTSEKALRFGDSNEAAQSLRELLRYFPEPDDPRHQQAKTRLNELSSSAIQ